VGVHASEKVGVGALLQQPALALELGGNRLVHLMELAELVQAANAPDGHAAQGHEGDHELTDHIGKRGHGCR